MTLKKQVKSVKKAKQVTTKRRTKRPTKNPAKPAASHSSQTPKAPKPEDVKVAALELREIRKTIDKFKKELRLSDDGTADPFLRERLFTDLALNFFYDGEQDSEAFLKEAREQKKVVGKGVTPPSVKRKSRKMTPQAEAQEVRRRWRQLHGLDDSSATTHPDVAE